MISLFKIISELIINSPISKIDAIKNINNTISILKDDNFPNLPYMSLTSHEIYPDEGILKDDKVIYNFSSYHGEDLLINNKYINEWVNFLNYKGIKFELNDNDEMDKQIIIPFKYFNIKCNY